MTVQVLHRTFPSWTRRSKHVDPGVQKAWVLPKKEPVAPLLNAKNNPALVYRDNLTKQYNAQLVAHDLNASKVAVTLCDDNQRLFYFFAVATDGNCGFAALAKGDGLNRRKQLTSNYMRTKLRNEVRSFGGYYSHEATVNDAFGIYYSDCDSDALCESVMQKGRNGHWLGDRWGNMEILALARALGVCIELYSYDANLGGIRCYERYDFGKQHIGLLFSGGSAGGHFDLLMKA
uniref:OTU domain-containing protein n=1 Tax=Timspurckia oligopyrenoides TaxID=708627 RepID=A0A7S0ZEQ9_9RHOD|mmetsp:Transcript_237/g.414  ORF Transcript_237/g.414 Transcript_237/m.414 type:complete len:233 (+) Transcript_237:101-799(+)